MQRQNRAKNSSHKWHVLEGGLNSKFWRLHEYRSRNVLITVLNGNPHTALHVHTHSVSDTIIVVTVTIVCFQKFRKYQLPSFSPVCPYVPMTVCPYVPKIVCPYVTMTLCPYVTMTLHHDLLCPYDN